MAINWTESKVKKLTKLWEKNISAREIAEKLGDGISRNAVIGKANRLGLTKDLTPKQELSLPDSEDDKIYLGLLSLIDSMPMRKNEMINDKC